MIADDIYQCLNISISLYFAVSTLKNLINMKVTTQSLYHQPGGEVVLGEFVEYFYDFIGWGVLYRVSLYDKACE